MSYVPSPVPSTATAIPGFNLVTLSEALASPTAVAAIAVAVVVVLTITTVHPEKLDELGLDSSLPLAVVVVDIVGTVVIVLPDAPWIPLAPASISRLNSVSLAEVIANLFPASSLANELDEFLPHASFLLAVVIVDVVRAIVVFARDPSRVPSAAPAISSLHLVSFSKRRMTGVVLTLETYQILPDSALRVTVVVVDGIGTILVDTTDDACTPPPASPARFHLVTLSKLRMPFPRRLRLVVVAGRPV
eukprot:scaffold731_cov261-Pinguiococcus_pyrenoidosus.AAC.120